MKSVLIVLILTTLNVTSLGQTNQNANRRAQESSVVQPRIVNLSAPLRVFRPRLTLQRALRVAERYIERERIDISPYYLYEAKYVLYGSAGNQEPAWFFWWVNENGSLGNYVQIVVSINTGEIRRLSTM